MDAVSPPVNKIQWYEKPLIMPLRDIIKEYREAKNPKKQIDILADLNHTRSCRIAWLLDRCGDCVHALKSNKCNPDSRLCDLNYYSGGGRKIVNLDGYCHLGRRKRGENADRCVCCGDVIPEGRQVCPACEGGGK